MRVINSTKVIPTYPKQITCEKCGAELEYEKSDITTRDYGTACIICPECDEKIFLYDEEEDCKTLTIDNLEFPNDYIHYGTDATPLTDKEINKYVKDCLIQLKQDEEDYGVFRFTGTGDTIVFVVKFEDEYQVFVCKNYHEASIDR